MTSSPTTNASTPSSPTGASQSPTFVVSQNLCSACNIPATDFLQCKKCNAIRHYICTDLPVYEIVKYTKENLYHRKYACKNCVYKLHQQEMDVISDKMKHPQRIDGNELLLNDYKKRLEIKNKELTSIYETASRTIGEKNEVRDENVKLQEEIRSLQRKNEDLLLTITVYDQKFTEYEEKERMAIESTKKKDEDSQEELKQETHDESRKISNKETQELRELMEQQQQRTRQEMDVLKHMIENITAMQQRPREPVQPANNINQHQQPYYRPRTYRRPPPTCYGCGRRGHLARDCYSTRRQRWNPPPRQYQPPRQFQPYRDPQNVYNPINYQPPYPPVPQQRTTSSQFHSVQPFV